MNIRRSFPTATVLASVPNTGDIASRLRLLFGRFPKQWIVHPGEHVRYWTLRDFKLMASQLGYDIVRVSPLRGRTLAPYFPGLMSEALVFQMQPVASPPGTDIRTGAHLHAPPVRFRPDDSLRGGGRVQFQSGCRGGTRRCRFEGGAGLRLGYRPALDGLRGIAILLVLGTHLGLPFLPGGYLGVDIFFVLSGFLITCLLVQEWQETGGISLKRFYYRRALRLFPVLFVAVAAWALWCSPSIPSKPSQWAGPCLPLGFTAATW